jgi:hypothetical protein
MRDSTCSAGRATMASTSRAEAPGQGTSTLAMVTSICGSSSLGVMRVANTPSSSSTSASSGVSALRPKPCAMRPEIPSEPLSVTHQPCLFFSFMMPSASSTIFS